MAAQDVEWVATARERLQSLSWFMKCLKEPLARLANRQDKTRGAFFEERFKSVAILDEESLLATCAYIDLNPVAAGIAEVPEASPHTSITERVGARQGPGPNQRPEGGRAGQRGGIECLGRTGRITSGSARLKIDGGSIRHVKGCSKESRWEVTCSWSITRAGCSAMARPRSQPSCPESSSGSGSNAESWWSRIEKLSKGRLLGRFFAASRERLREVARAPGRTSPGEPGRVPGAVDRIEDYLRNSSAQR